jgi:hypothetical protein
MARFYGSKSGYLIKNEKINRIAVVVYCVIGLVILYVVFVNNFQHLFSLSGIIALAIVFGPFIGFAMYRIKKHKKEYICFYRGRKGEGAIWYKLKRFNDSYSIFQDLKIGENLGNIDFVIVGPGGIYTLEVKSHSGKIGFDGEKLTHNGKPFEKDFLKQAKSEALQVHDFLKEKPNLDIFVKPVIVFSGHVSVRFGLKPIDGVCIIGKSFLVEFFKKEVAIDFPKFQIEEALKTLTKI